jgi:hypothetical protein
MGMAMSAKRKAAVCIGVGQAGRHPPLRLPYLAGAVNSARWFHQWATALGYESTLLIDDPDPVTIPRLRQTLESVLRPPPGQPAEPIHRLVLYFAGHGLIREVEEGLWLLSDWDDELRAVAAEGLRRRLYMHGIAQIAIFADACRKLPAEVEVADLVPDPVLGRGPVRNATPPAIDKFIAAQDGKEAYMLPGLSPEQDVCIFTGVLLEGLWGTKPTAFSKLLKDKVTSRSLAAYLQAEVPKTAGRYKRTLVPTVSPTFPEDDDIYYGDGPAPSAPALPVWPTPESVSPMGPIAGDLLKDVIKERVKDVIGYWDRLAEATPDILGTRHRQEPQAQPLPSSPRPTPPSVLERLRDQPRPPSFETGSGFAVDGAEVTRVFAPAGIVAEQHGQASWWRIGGPDTAPLSKPVPVLIEFADGPVAAVTALPDFIATVLRDQRGVAGLVYREVHSPPTIAAPTEQAIAALDKGALRAESVLDLAAELRQQKHVDPVLGVISAYLYDSIGDIDGIRRMAAYYVANYQPIPYDIALLAQIVTHTRDDLLWAEVPAVGRREPRTDTEQAHAWTFAATPACGGVVGGHWPWLRQGWVCIDDPLDVETPMIRPGLETLIQHLAPGRFTTVDRAGAERLAAMFRLEPTARA